jgi:hypothetical protein
MGRAPGPKAEAAVAEARIEDGCEHLQQRLLDQPIQRRRHPQQPLAAGGLGDRHPPDRLRPVGARLEPTAGFGPVAVKPGPQLRRRHPVDARGTGVLLDASERPSEVVAGEERLPQTRPGGVRRGLIRRREAAPLSTGLVGLHPPSLPPRPHTGLAAITATPTSTSVLRLGSAFGPSRRPSRSPPVLRPLLTSPRRAATSRPPPSRAGTPLETSRDKPRHLLHTPAAFTLRPLDDDGLHHRMLARPDRPASDAVRVARVMDSHSGFLPTPPHNGAVAIGSWLASPLPQGLTPPSDAACPAYMPKPADLSVTGLRRRHVLTHACPCQAGDAARFWGPPRGLGVTKWSTD